MIPAGEFQPSSIAPPDLINDFDIWRKIVREFSEECHSYGAVTGAADERGRARPRGVAIQSCRWALRGWRAGAGVRSGVPAVRRHRAMLRFTQGCWPGSGVWPLSGGSCPGRVPGR